MIWWLRSWRAIVVLGAGLAAALITYPTLLLGADTGLGWASLKVGLFWGLLAGGLAGSACVLGIGLVEYEGGLRSARYVSGSSLAGQTSLQLVVAVLHALGACLIVFLFTVAGAMIDWAARSLGGKHGDMLALADGFSWSSLTEAGATCFGLITVVWLLLTGARSSTTGAICIAAGVATWIAALVATRTLEHREFLAAHPLAAPWRALGVRSAPSLTVDAPPWLYWCTAALWLLLLCAAAGSAIRRP
jgi:hypothetical protein